MIPPGEKIVETKKCRLSGKEFVVTDKDLEFYNKISPLIGGKKFNIPLPTLCPEERSMRRLSRRNEKSFYQRKCDKTGESIISGFSPQKPFPVYSQNAWLWDSWSPYDYGFSYDFEKNAFEQFLKLQNVVPHIALENVANENSPYVSHSAWNKDCHLIFYSDKNERCMYLNNSFHNKDCFDSSYILRCEQTYGSHNCRDSYRLFFSKDCHECRDSYFLESCSWCHDCFGCVGLKNKSYHLFGQSLSETEYRQKISELKLTTESSLEKVQKVIYQKNLHILRRHMVWTKNENCFWDALSECANIFEWYYLEKSSDCRYIQDSQRCRDCMDMSGWGGSWVELVYECASVWDGAYNIIFSNTIWDGQKNSLYSEWCGGWENCLLSIGVRKWKNVILNKSYGQEEYETLSQKIIEHMVQSGEWWEFFPVEHSPFFYNETTAYDYYPLSNSEIQKRGWWIKEESDKYSGSNYTPLTLDNYDEKNVGYEIAQKNIETLLSATLVCTLSGKAFKITKQELLFYLQNNLPIPTKHYEQRHKTRMWNQNKRELYNRNCAECSRDMITTYSPERQEKVVCEECYRKLVY